MKREGENFELEQGEDGKIIEDEHEEGLIDVA